MSKLKIILCTVAIFIISAVGCFADSLPGQKTYLYKLENKNMPLYYTSDSEISFVYKSDDKVYCSSDSNIYTSMTGSSWSWVGKTDVFHCYGYVKFNGTEYKTPTVDIVLNEGVSSGGDESIVPPVIAPMEMEKILPQFLEQLKNYLPTCITILAMLLGVSLVPRLIRCLM